MPGWDDNLDQQAFEDFLKIFILTSNEAPTIGLPNFDSRVSWIVSIGSCLFGVVSVSRADFSSRRNTTISSSRLLSASRSILRTTNEAELTKNHKGQLSCGRVQLGFSRKDNQVVITHRSSLSPTAPSESRKVPIAWKPLTYNSFADPCWPIIYRC